jgi:FkbM family methyltransferase
MTIKHTIRQLALRAGIEVRRFNAAESAGARLGHQLRTHAVDLVLDVGANDGGYGRMLRQTGYRGDILSFEPLSAAHAALLLATAGDARWHVAPRGALGDADGEVTINIAGNSTSSSILPMGQLHADAAPTSRYQGQEVTALRRLDGIDHPALQSARSVLLKIDTQGYEMAVLRGAGALLQRIRGVQVELSVVPLYEGQPVFDQVLGFLRDQGFELWDVSPGFVDPQSGRMLQFDGMFYRP